MQEKNNRNKIKLMFIIDFIMDITGGTENQLVKLVNHLEKDKYELYLLSMRKTGWLSDNVKSLHCNIKIYEIVRLRDPINIFRFFLIVKYIKKVKPDIVMTFFALSNILGVIAAKLAGARIIISTRRDYGVWLSLVFRHDIHLLRFVNRFLKGIVTNSYNVKELMIKLEKVERSKIHVIYNGINAKKFEQSRQDRGSLKEMIGIPSGDPVIGILAGLRPMKRHVTFLNAAKRVLQERNDTHFVIIGDGPLRNELESFTDQLGIRDHVHFLGWEKDVVRLLSILDIGVNCSANEGLSNAIMEYMAYGIPCIVSRAGGNEELVKNGVNGLTFELNNARELSDLIIGLLDNERKRREYAERGKEIIGNEFSIQRMVTNYDRLFSNLLSEEITGAE